VSHGNSHVVGVVVGRGGGGRTSHRGGKGRREGGKEKRGWELLTRERKREGKGNACEGKIGGLFLVFFFLFSSRSVEMIGSEAGRGLREFWEALLKLCSRERLADGGVARRRAEFVEGGKTR